VGYESKISTVPLLHKLLSPLLTYLFLDQSQLCARKEGKNNEYPSSRVCPVGKDGWIRG